MDHGYKHFSHLHNLIMHQMPEGIQVSCSGCHSSATGTVYVCWQCNFFLHDQCYRATRSLKHPSHPHHPLTLVPYPTYHSSSFYCNSCQMAGTGFSYSCADCEFDLHVQCAYSITRATSFNNAAHLFQELVPTAWSGMQNATSVSIPTSYPLNLVPSVLDSSQNGHSVSIQTSSHNSSVHYPSIGQPGPCVSVPPNPVPSLQDAAMTQNKPASVPLSSNDPSKSETGPSVSIPTNNPLPRDQDPSMPPNKPSDAIPTSYSSNPIPRDQDPSVPLSKPSASIPTNNQVPKDQDPSMPQNRPLVSIPTNPSNPNKSSHVPSMPQNGFEDKENIMHFSHPHKLSKVNIQEDEENEVICSGCEETLIDEGYKCCEPNCNFHLHESCFHLTQQIHHKSHPEHPLTLLYNNKNGEYTCNACFSDGTGFTYHCSTCRFDLHVQCVSLPETVKRDDHKHMLKLFYSCAFKDEDYTFSCNVCHGEVQKDRWVYYCESCDYGTHLGCVDCEECERDSILDVQAQLQRLQLQMEMARQQAQLMASMGSSLSSLVG